MKISYILLLTLLIPNIIFSQKNVKNYSILDNYEKGQSISYQNNRYVHLPGLEAQKESVPTSTSALNQEAQTESNDVLFSKGGFVVKQKKSTTTTPLFNQSSEIYPVVGNLRSQKIGVVLGNLVANMENVELADQLLAKYNLSGVKKYSNLKTVIFRAKYPYQVFEVIEGIKKEPSINKVEIEIFESAKKPL